MSADTEKMTNILTKYEGQNSLLIQALLEIQRQFKWIPDESISIIAEKLRVPKSRIFRVASYYKAMSLKPRGKHIIRVCLGTACHVREGGRIMDRVEEVLGVSESGTTPDMNFTLERVNCLGCCALGPVMVIDGEYFGKMEIGKVSELVNKYR
jgi:NADH-quinone oxidoreductase subunit E